MRRLQGKVCLITGAASGIGEAAVHTFVREGATVVAVDINAAALARLYERNNAVTTKAVDVCQAHALADVVAQLSRVDVLFNCAGVVKVGDVLECSSEDWHQSFDVNVTAVFNAIRCVLPSMLEQGAGSIINMASVISSMGGAPQRFAYGASKAAVIGMTRSVARDFAHRGVRCNAICPSAVDTPSMNARIESMPDAQAARREFNTRQPVGRMGRPEEIADLALYLASDESQFTTGSSIVIDGGTRA